MRSAAVRWSTWLAARLCSTMQTRSLAAAVRLEAGLLLDDLRGQHGLSPPGLDDFHRRAQQPGCASANTRSPIASSGALSTLAAMATPLGRKPAWWSEQGWRYRRSNDWKAPRYWDDRRFNRDTQPGGRRELVGGRCLPRLAQQPGQRRPPAGRKRLSARRAPGAAASQEEWMAAARNRRPAPAEDLDYPWRGTFEPERATRKRATCNRPHGGHVSRRCDAGWRLRPGRQRVGVDGGQA
jgi:hypothetical protein